MMRRGKGRCGRSVLRGYRIGLPDAADRRPGALTYLLNDTRFLAPGADGFRFLGET